MFPIITKFRKNLKINYLVIFLRYLIGYSFIPSGMIKLMGMRFTYIPVTNPIGYFFDALYQSGIYWEFLGFFQLISALFLLSQRFAAIGALLFFTIISNIFLITIGINFGNTRYVSGLLWLASLFLLIWDYQKFLPLFNTTKKVFVENYMIEISFLKWEYLGIFLFIFHFFSSALMLHYKGYVSYGVPFIVSVLSISLTFFWKSKLNVSK